MSGAISKANAKVKLLLSNDDAAVARKTSYV